MESMQCCGIDSMFNQKVAMKELRTYQKSGVNKTTRILIDQLVPLVEENSSLLDIGGGIGAISHELSRTGISKLINVDASKAYLHVAQTEADRFGYGEKSSFYYGDFVTLASQIPSTDLVTLDRVICCYSDMQSLVTKSIERTKNYYGIVYPRDSWWVKFGIFGLNLFQRVKRSNYRSYVHDPEAIHAIIHAHGFKRVFKRNKGIWIVEVFEKESPSLSSI
ncbi:MAG: methyltransferase domain-containing protein [Candidatus Hodarchaeales archaeon]|jgi:magnesium-protoporphyrin O-methyltransferase